MVGKTIKREVICMAKEKLTTNRILLRLGIVSIVGIIIWNGLGYITDFLLGDTIGRIHRLLIALITTILTVALLEVARRIDKLSWKQLGVKSVRTNFCLFSLGFFLWLIPAAIGVIICITFGWVEITLHSNWDVLIVSLLLLIITVFFMEALPEELMFRGYMYRYLHILFPHWATVLLQASLFTLFAYFVGALYSVEQIQFIPGFALILGYIRSVSGNVWTSIGFHVAIMTAFQILSPLHEHVDVSGMFALKFFAFILLPSAIGAIALGFIYPNHKWSKKASMPSL